MDASISSIISISSICYSISFPVNQYSRTGMERNILNIVVVRFLSRLPADVEFDSLFRRRCQNDNIPAGRTPFLMECPNASLLLFSSVFQNLFLKDFSLGTVEYLYLYLWTNLLVAAHRRKTSKNVEDRRWWEIVCWWRSGLSPEMSSYF